MTNESSDLASKGDIIGPAGVIGGTAFGAIVFSLDDAVLMQILDLARHGLDISVGSSS